MKTYCFFIKNNVTSSEKLPDLQQRITYYSESLNQIETISIRHYREIQSLDQP